MPTRRRWSAASGLAALLVVIAACADEDADSAPTTTPQALTAIAVEVATPAYYVPASDGSVHLEYDLVMTNASDEDVELQSLTVTAEDVELAHFEGASLEAVTFPFLGPPTTTVAASGAAYIVLDVVLPSTDVGDVPTEVRNHVTYAMPGGTLETILGSDTATGPPVDVERRDPVVVQPPLRGAGWWNFNGCCTPTAHRGALIPADGTLTAFEMFAIDWVRLIDGEEGVGDGSQLTDHHAYGATVYSATDGEVVSVRDDQQEAPINQSAAGNETVHGPADYPGNHVVVKFDDDRYATYLHLQPGSVRVAVGETVAPGDELGLLGNSGNTTSPHLHFSIQDGPEPLTSNSVPFVIEDYQLAGRATITPDGSGFEFNPQPSAQHRTMPLVYDVTDFESE